MQIYVQTFLLSCVIKPIILDLILVVTVYNHVIYSESYAPSSQVDIVEVQNLNCLILQACGSNNILRVSVLTVGYFNIMDILGCDTM